MHVLQLLELAGVVLTLTHPDRAAGVLDMITTAITTAIQPPTTSTTTPPTNILPPPTCNTTRNTAATTAPAVLPTLPDTVLRALLRLLLTTTDQPTRTSIHILLRTLLHTTEVLSPKHAHRIVSALWHDVVQEQTSAVMVADDDATGRGMAAVHVSARGALGEAAGALAHAAKEGLVLLGVGRARCAALAAAWGGAVGVCSGGGGEVPVGTGMMMMRRRRRRMFSWRSGVHM